MKTAKHYSHIVLFIMMNNWFSSLFPFIFSCAAVVGSLDVGEEMTEEVGADHVSEQEELSSCTRLLAAAAERVWDIFVQNKREVSVIRK